MPRYPGRAARNLPALVSLIILNMASPHCGPRGARSSKAELAVGTGRIHLVQGPVLRILRTFLGAGPLPDLGVSLSQRILACCLFSIICSSQFFLIGSK
ncbi:uncharacterized protein EI97DRAFT_257879 [Westerdykella ornata]|uniref:Secreted protein n=1 Tax=Westerdykella ornata TaxID=318751 RepID=A0A6A6JPU7_WESOR|nr:uncharacterized protein EI97DRAFT_257879 [Westerdykella ornata]KAF2278552.1 hypothetical protein EI97DRAFT_257879 [Westerdykella ornata]